MKSDKSFIGKGYWDFLIKPQRGLCDLNIKELWEYRDLISLFVQQGFIANYKQAILGSFWYLVQPILPTQVFTAIFGHNIQLSTDGLRPFMFFLAGNTGRRGHDVHREIRCADDCGRNSCSWKVEE